MKKLIAFEYAENSYTLSQSTDAISNTKERIIYIDFLRGFAAILVVVLHCISDYIINPALYSSTSWYINIVLNAIVRTAVPIFFMISGYLMLSSDNTKNFKLFYKKRLVHIFIPLIFWNIAYFVYKVFTGYMEFGIGNFLKEFLNYGTQYHLWFLYTLIALYLISPFLKIVIDNCNIKHLLWFLFLTLFSTSIIPFINYFLDINIYLFDPLFNGYVGCFLMGYILGKTKLNNIKILLFNACALICFILSVLTHHFSSSNQSINLVLNSGHSLCHYVLAATLFINARFWIKNNINPVFKKCILLLSNISFGIYLIHAMVLDVVSNHFMIDASPIVCSMYKFCITIIVSSIISYIFGKIKYIKKIVL